MPPINFPEAIETAGATLANFDERRSKFKEEAEEVSKFMSRNLSEIEARALELAQVQIGTTKGLQKLTDNFPPNVRQAYDGMYSLTEEDIVTEATTPEPLAQSSSATPSQSGGM